MATTQGYIFDETAGTFVDTLNMELGWNGPLQKSYYEAMSFGQFGALGTVSVKAASLNVPSVSSIGFEIVTRDSTGTVHTAITGTFPANTYQADAAALTLSVASVQNTVANTGYGLQPTGGFTASQTRTGLFTIPNAPADASGFKVTLQLAIA